MKRKTNHPVNKQCGPRMSCCEWFKCQLTSSIQSCFDWLTGANVRIAGMTLDKLEQGETVH